MSAISAKSDSTNPGYTKIENFFSVKFLELISILFTFILDKKLWKHGKQDDEHLD